MTGKERDLLLLVGQLIIDINLLPKANRGDELATQNLKDLRQAMDAVEAEVREVPKVQSLPPLVPPQDVN